MFALTDSFARCRLPFLALLLLPWRWARLRLGAAVLVALLFAWSLNYWNLLGWRM